MSRTGAVEKHLTDSTDWNAVLYLLAEDHESNAGGPVSVQGRLTGED